MSAAELPDYGVIEAPRTRPTARARRPRRRNVELYGWVFMRLSGIVLIGLVLAHIVIMTMVDGGVHRIGWGFVAGRYASPFWRLWDLVQLWLAELHGANGLRTVINDYAERPQTRFWLQSLLALSVFLTVSLGTLVIFTFSPDMS